MPLIDEGRTPVDLKLMRVKVFAASDLAVLETNVNTFLEGLGISVGSRADALVSITFWSPATNSHACAISYISTEGELP